jgi:hypothetical protein
MAADEGGRLAGDSVMAGGIDEDSAMADATVEDGGQDEFDHHIAI